MSEGVTVVVTRTVRAGMEEQAEAWFVGVGEVAGKYPGHLGITIFRPRAGQRDYTFVFRFAGEDTLAAWARSADRTEWLRRAESFTERVTIHQHTGLETWFEAPGVPIVGPPRWKMVCVSWCVAFPLVQLLGLTVGVALADLPRLLAGAITVLVMVLTMTYLAMPFATKAAAKWLYPPPPP
jgi:antibiotic biosynthesis monooxygenase (ABM) superfamily enzyme